MWSIEQINQGKTIEIPAGTVGKVVQPKMGTYFSVVWLELSWVSGT